MSVITKGSVKEDKWFKTICSGCYAHCAVSANWAAGRGEGIIEMHEIESNLECSMQEIRKLLVSVLANT